ncbi:prolactin receptor [Nowakowskiella sp. JEL0407]|nr:prolactin receptor [Nowakowskiella sp. JEL0407]
MSDNGSEADVEETGPNIGTYVGERNEAKERHGKGRNTFPNGDIYDGMYENGKRSGTGTYIWKNGTRYIGEFKDNKRNGQGQFVYLDGSFYKGQFENGRRNGTGVFKYANGDEYDGQWKDDLKHGKGTYTFGSLKSKKKGIWEQGILKGPGEIVHADHKIIGTFTENDVMQAPAKIQFTSNGYTITVRDPLILGSPNPAQSGILIDTKEVQDIDKVVALSPSSDNDSNSSAPQSLNRVYRHGTNSSNSSSPHTPVVRSRTSFSFNISSMIKSPPKNIVGIEIGNSLEKKVGVDKPNNDLFLRDIEGRGFSGIWNHPITRCYFLMYLLWRGYETFYFLRMEVHQYRVDFFNLHLSARKTQALRIFNTYLSRNAVNPVPFPANAEGKNARRIISDIKFGLENPDQTLFDDLAYLVINIMESIYHGTFIERSGGTSGSNGSLEQPPKRSFVKSAFYQAMYNDLRGTKHITTTQYNRAAERIMDMPSYIFETSDLVDKILNALEAIGVDTEPWRPKTTNLHRAVSSKRSKAKSMSNLDSNSDIKKSLQDLDKAPPSLKDKDKEWKRASTYNLNMSGGELPHAFVQFVNNQQQYCEYCFNDFIAEREGEEKNAPYQCESCGYVCHRNCRNMTRMKCVKRVDTGQDFEHEHIDKMKRISDKIQAVQKEIDIEMRIRDGLDKMNKAKTPTSLQKKTKLTPAEQDMLTQVEKSNHKLEVLKHELQKCRMQLANLSTIVPVETAVSSEMIEELDRLRKRDETGEVVRVTTLDPVQKSVATKTFFVTPTTTVRQIVGKALEKFVLPGKEEDYEFTYLGDDGGEIPMREQDILQDSGIKFAQTVFNIRLKEEKQMPNTIETVNIINSKQQEVLTELIETETGYVTALRNIITTCESNPRLNKLSLADLLVKPMHRLTRYPIILKRLLSHTKNPREMDAINALINKIEDKVALVNETLRKMEGAYRINLIDEGLDFNNVTEKFKLANDSRELIIEKTFHFIRKNGSTPVEVVVMVFTDLVLITKLRKLDQFVLFKQPIPLESCVFLDKPDHDGMKNIFQIIHLQQEIHHIQAMSAFDKSTFLLKAEELRSNFCANYLSFEQSLMKEKTLSSTNNSESLQKLSDGDLTDPLSPADFGPRRRITNLSTHSDSSRNRDDHGLLQRTSSWTHLVRNGGGRSSELISEMEETTSWKSKFSGRDSLYRSSSLKKTTYSYETTTTTTCSSPTGFGAESFDHSPLSDCTSSSTSRMRETTASSHASSKESSPSRLFSKKSEDVHGSPSSDREMSKEEKKKKKMSVHGGFKYLKEKLSRDNLTDLK